MKLRILAVSLMLSMAAICVSAQTYSRMDFSLQTAQGQAVAGATVNVYTQTAWGVKGTVPATLYLTPNGTPLSGPPITDGTGHAYAYAAFPANGYTVQYSSPYTSTTTYLDQVTESYYPASTATPYAVLTGGATANSPYYSVPIGTAGLPLLSGGPSAYPGFGVLGIPGGGSGANTSQGAATNIVDTNKIKPSSIATNQQILNPPASGPSTVMIQAALVGTANDIYLAPGTYTTDRLSLNRSNVTLHGAGKGITIIQATCPYTLTPQYGVNGGGLLYVWPTSGSLSNVHITDATFLGCDSTVNITSITLDGTNAIITANQHLTAGQNVGFIGLVGGATTAMNGGGFWTVLSSGLSSTQFEVSYNGATPGGPYAQTAASYWLWNGSVAGYGDHQGIVIDGCTSCSVERVAVDHMGAESILFSPSIIGDYPLMQNDDVFGGSNNSISANFAFGARFINNTVSNTYSGNCIGWSGDATVAQGNVIRNCSGFGIGAGGSGYQHLVLGYDAEISGNIIDGAHNGIQLSDDGATSTTSRWYDVANNTITNYSVFGFESDLTQAGDVVFIKGLNVTGGVVNGNAEFSGDIAVGFNNGNGTYYISNSDLIGSGTSSGQTYGIAVLSGSPVIIPANNTISGNVQGDIVTIGGTPTFTNGINLLTDGSQVPSLEVTGLTPGKCVDTGTNGLLKSTADDCGSGGGSGPIPSNANFVFTGTSRIDSDGETQAPIITISGWTAPSSEIVIFTNSGTNGLHTGDWVNLRFVNSSDWPTSIIGTGLTLFQVLPTGLSSTQFEVNIGSLAGVSACSSSCGTVLSAMNSLPFVVTNQPGMPAAANANTYVTVSNSATIVNEAATYATYLHPWSPAVTGHPAYLTISDPWNDIGVCSSVATIEAAYTSLIEQAHTDGYKVVIPSVIANSVSSTYGAGFCPYPLPPYEEMIVLDSWLRTTISPTIENKATGDYWDLYVDLGRTYNDPYNSALVSGSPTAWQMWGQAEANALISGSGMPLPSVPLYFGNSAGTEGSASNGYIFVPSADSLGTWQWLNSSYQDVFRLDTSDGDFAFYLPGTIEDTTNYGTTPIVLQVIENGTAAMDYPLATFLAPNEGTGSTQWLEFGHDRGNNDDIALGFNYVSSGGVDNYLTLGLTGSTGIKIDGSGNFYVPGIATSPSTAPVCPNGTNGAFTTSGCVTGTGSGITALTGDVAASGPGSAAATLATVNSSPGSYTNANITVNAKGLITSASNGSGGGGSSSIAPVLVQWNCATITAAVSPCVLGTGSAIATLSNTTAGSCILVKAFHGNGSAGSAVPTDGQSNIYTLYNYQQISAEFDFYEWVATNIAGGPLTVTITGDTPINVMVVEEIANCGGVDVYSSAQASPSNPPSYTLSTGSATTTTTYDLIDVTGAIRNGSGVGTFSETNGYTSTITNLAEGGALVYNGWTGIAPTTGSLSDTLTFTGTVGAMYSSFIAFAPRVAVGAVTASAPLVATQTGKNVNLTCPSCIGGSGNYINIGASVTASGCTMSGSAPYVCTVGSPVTAITLSSIPGTYLNLELSLFGTGTSSATQTSLTFNGDTGSHYDYTNIYSATGTSPSNLVGNAASSAPSCVLGTASYGGGGKIVVTRYANTSFYKPFSSSCGSDGPSSTFQYAFIDTGTWQSTAAVTSITLTIASGDFSVGDTLAIYGTN